MKEIDDNKVQCGSEAPGDYTITVSDFGRLAELGNSTRVGATSQ